HRCEDHVVTDSCKWKNCGVHVSGLRQRRALLRVHTPFRPHACEAALFLELTMQAHWSYSTRARYVEKHSNDYGI
ncbi:hypothetical protein BT69DRAFT_1234103, partial [Atractiella rhizophila]